MRHQQRDQESELQTATTKMLAAASATPFWTAFKITLGIGLAQFLMFLGGVSTIALVVYLLLK